MAAPTDARALLGRLELGAVLLLLLAALAPRLRDAAASLDRGFDGQQGAFFAIGAVNAERLTVRRTGGYPVLNLDLGDRADAATRLWDRPEHWLVYANHPPTVALVAWASLNVMGPQEWNSAWREGRGPEGFELALRLPFLLLNVAALVALWWAVRAGHGPRAGLLALALAAGLPVLVVHAGLVNYENACLPFVLLGTGFYARWMRQGRRRDLVVLGVAFAAGGAVTWAPLFFASALAAHALLSARRWRGLMAAVVATLACLAPLAAHALWAARTLRALGQPPLSTLERAHELLGPLLDGQVPLSSWVGLQLGRSAEWCTLPLLVAAAAGLLVCLAQARRGPQADPQRVLVALPLALGGWLYMASFYRHTVDAQTPFLMMAAPGFAALGAVAVDALAPRLLRLRAGIAPLVVLVSSIAVFGLARTSVLRHALRAPLGDTTGGLAAPETALPREDAAAIAEVLPSGALGLHPAPLGLNLAVPLYAWRSLWPVAGGDDTAPDAVAARLGLAAAPRWLLLPDAPPPRLADELTSLRTTLVGERAPDASARGWSGWRVR
jgi:hypothetical protein